MATTVGQHSVAAFTSPVNGTTPIDANSVRGNDNTMRSAYVDHDADTGIHVQSSTLASRPAAGTAGRKWITEDSGIYTLWFDDGVHWHPVSSEAVAITVLATENLVKGDVVKVVGWNNGQDLAEVAKTTSASDVAFAVITAAVSSGVLGYATNTGVLQDINTNAYAVGTVLYPNASGGFTSTKPTSGNYQPVAYVLRQNTNNGVIYVEFSAPRIVERSDNTASTIVLRDASGNFSAGTITFAGLKGTGATTVTDILNDGTMATASATTLATSSSIKTYVDSQVATVDTLAEVLANGNTTGATDIIVNAGQKIRTPAVAAQDGTAALTIANTTGTVTAAGTLNATTLGGTLSTAAQPNVTSVGTLTSLTVSGDITASAGSSTDPSITFSGYTNWGFGIDGTGLRMVAGGAGTTTTFTTTGLTTNNAVVSGDLTVDTSTLKVDSANNRVGIGTATPSTTLEVVGSSGAANIRDTQAYSFGTSGSKLFFQGLDNLGGLTTFAYLHASPANGNQDRGFLDIFTRVDGVATKTLEIGTGLSGNVSVPNGNFIVDTNTLYVDAANNRVGVGTASPGVALDVVNSALGIVRVRGGGGTNEGGAFFISNSAGSSTLAAFGDYARIGGGATDASVSIYTNASIPLRFDVGGTEKMRLDASGNLGLGTASPAYPLHVERPSYGMTGYFFANDGTRNPRLAIYGNSSGTTIQHTFSTGADALMFAVGGAVGSGTEKMRLDSNGNLGIGTSSPAALLHLKAPTNPVIQFEEASGSGFIDYNATRLQLHGGGGSMYFVTGNAERMRLDSSGNLGIGTASPSEVLSVAGNATANAYKLRANTSAPASTDAFIYRPADNTLAFGTASAEKMRLDASGRLGIGTSSPRDALTVAGGIISTGTIASTGANAIGIDNNGTVSRIVSYGPNTTTAGAIAFLNVSSNVGVGGEVMRLDASGRLGIGTTGPGYPLDVVGFGRFSSGVIGSAGLTMYGDASSASGMFLSTSGNLGLGVTPSAWWSTARVMQVGNGGYVQGRSNAVNTVEIGANQFINSSVQRTYIGNGEASYYEQAGGAHQFYTAASGTAGNAITFTQAMTLTAGGNLLLGTTSDAAGFRLSTNAGASSNGHLIAGSGTGIYSNWSDGTATDSPQVGGIGNALVFRTSSTERARIDSSGRLLVGLTSNSTSGPIQALVNGTGTSYQTNPAVFGAVTTVAGREVPMVYATDGTNSSLVSMLSGTMAFFTNGSERARILSTGEFAIGKTTAASALDVHGELRVGYGVDHVEIGATGLNVYIAAASSQGLALEAGGATRLQISSTGNVVAGTSAVATNATNGFLYVPTCAGTPTGTPASYGGRAPIVIDTTNNKLYFYSGGAWRDAGP